MAKNNFPALPDGKTATRIVVKGLVSGAVLQPVDAWLWIANGFVGYKLPPFWSDDARTAIEAKASQIRTASMTDYLSRVWTGASVIQAKPSPVCLAIGNVTARVFWGLDAGGTPLGVVVNVDYLAPWRDGLDAHGLAWWINPDIGAVMAGIGTPDEPDIIGLIMGLRDTEARASVPYAERVGTLAAMRAGW